ncbi:hypothetical protein KZZ52_27750 [Dactylosporangium sp. AC04546]|uniref:hypothetical protein n=1 Tax=Dactylosporangium sp. AC04546 TaxID=2862460 RepID=UPI002E7B5E2C|nr:hypothetical protein [Dactylosporangium sp. AC04546]WVK89061.1 hypothetical protein KZZ52_27750 [Dactylosporangium sp. AC04546]
MVADREGDPIRQPAGGARAAARREAGAEARHAPPRSNGRHHQPDDPPATEAAGDLPPGMSAGNLTPGAAAGNPTPGVTAGNPAPGAAPSTQSPAGEPGTARRIPSPRGPLSELAGGDRSEARRPAPPRAYPPPPTTPPATAPPPTTAPATAPPPGTTPTPPPTTAPVTAPPPGTAPVTAPPPGTALATAPPPTTAPATPPRTGTPLAPAAPGPTRAAAPASGTDRPATSEPPRPAPRTPAADRGADARRRPSGSAPDDVEWLAALAAEPADHASDHAADHAAEPASGSVSALETASGSASRLATASGSAGAVEAVPIGESFAAATLGTFAAPAGDERWSAAAAQRVTEAVDEPWAPREPAAPVVEVLRALAELDVQASGRSSAFARAVRAVRAIGVGIVDPGAIEALDLERELVASVCVPQRRARVVAVVSGQGGTGTTATAAGIALTLAALREDTTVLADARAGTGSLTNRLAGRPGPGLREVAGGPRAALPYIGDGGLRLVDGAPPTEPLHPDDLRAAVDELTMAHTFTLLDVGNDLSPAGQAAVRLADQVVIVTTASDEGLRSAQVALDRLGNQEQDGWVPAVFAVVRMRPESDGQAHRRLRRLTDGSAEAALVPYDRHLSGGGRVDPARIRPATRQAYLALAALVAGAGT